MGKLKMEKSALMFFAFFVIGCGIKIGNPEGQRPPGGNSPAASLKINSIEANSILERTLESFTTGDYLFRERSDLNEPQSTCTLDSSREKISFNHSSSVERVDATSNPVKISQAFVDVFGVVGNSNCGTSSNEPELDLNQALTLNRTFQNSRQRSHVFDLEGENGAVNQWTVDAQGTVDLLDLQISDNEIKGSYRFTSDETISYQDSTQGETSLAATEPITRVESIKDFKLDWQKVDGSSSQFRVKVLEGTVKGIVSNGEMTLNFKDVEFDTLSCEPQSGGITLQITKEENSKQYTYNVDTKAFESEAGEPALPFLLKSCFLSE